MKFGPSDFAQRMKVWLARNFRVFGAAGAALFVPISLWFVGWLLVGDKLLLVRWGAFAAPWLAMLALLAAGLFVLGHRLLRALFALAVAFFVIIPALPRFNPIRWLTSPSPGDLRVMTFNTSDMNSNYGAIGKVIVRERADIVMLQQISDLSALKAQISRTPGHFNYFSYPEHAADTVILSRFPLSQSQAYDDRVTSGDRVTSVATIGKCQIRLWDLHAPHGQFAIENQEQFFAEAVSALGDEKLPLIVAGDLNSTEFNSAQAPLRAELWDAYAEMGKGFGFTFPSKVRRFGMLGRIFRIDHVFFRGLKSASAWVVRDNAGSDHFGVMATFRFQQYCA
jgi:vancomycin resistance protein VanJ